MTDPAPDAFDDVNDAVSAEWEAETTPYERVRDVISYTYDPVSAEALAEDARTSPKTARKHLRSLADEGFVATEIGDHGATYYRRSATSLVVEQAADIREHVSTDELIDRITELRATISDFQDEYGVESPEELIVEQANQTLAESASEQEGIDADALQEWQTVRRNLAFANAALAIGNAERFVDDGGSSPETGLSTP